MVSKGESEVPLLSYVPISIRTRALVYYLSVHVLFVLLQERGVIQQLRLLKTCDIYKRQLLKFIFKLIHKQLPHYFKQFTFTFRNQQHNYATRTCQNVFIQNVDHEIAKRSIRFTAPAGYNSTHGNIIDKIYSHSFI